jgi:hypothetical protein
MVEPHCLGERKKIRVIGSLGKVALRCAHETQPEGTAVRIPRVEHHATLFTVFGLGEEAWMQGWIKKLRRNWKN